MRTAHWVIISWLLLPSLTLAQSAFDGTWRPDPERSGQPRQPEISVLADGMYHPYFDSISATIVDPHHLRLIGRKGGKVIADTTIAVSADGINRTDVQTVNGMAPVALEFTHRYKRASAGPTGSHLISGGWQWTETELSNHVEDTVYKIVDSTLSMSDRMGRSFSAKLDGTEAPYRGDSEFTSVSVKQIDTRTIVESDLNNGHVVKIATWTAKSDGKTMHVRFDDTKGHIQEQVGHKVQ